MSNKSNNTKSGGTESDKNPFQNPIEKNFEKIVTPFDEFIHDHMTGSIFLIICTVFALAIANSPLAEAYQTLINTHAGFKYGQWVFEKTIHHWINDGLMAVFFFVIGLEIKREVLAGELMNPEKSIPIIIAAIGGMLMPALIYYNLNPQTPNIQGWGIPMATDTAFAVGVLALLRNHIPSSVTVFLTALAIIDDIGAILVIALFYTENLQLGSIAISLALLVFLLLLNVFGVRRPGVYLTIGVLLWFAMQSSGVHATVAGILVALAVPARPKHSPRWFLKKARALISKFDTLERRKIRENTILSENEQHTVIEQIQESAKKASTPLQRWERGLEFPVALFVLPIFAVTNAGIPLSISNTLDMFSNPVSIGIILGLLVGKTFGIVVFTWLALRIGLGKLPERMNMKHVIGIGLLGAVGFTMSIFVAALGFGEHSELILTSKLAIIFTSFIAGLSGYFWLRYVK